MKGFVLCLFPLLLIGCSGMFDSNLFSSIDPPPALDANALSAKSATDLEAMINNDASFMKSLQGNSAALTAVHNVLYATYKNVSSGDPAATKTTVINAAQADIMAETFGTNAGSVVTAAITQASNLLNGGGSVGTAISALFGGKSTAEITSELTTLQTIGTAFDKMRQEATTVSTSPLDTATFFGTVNKGNLAQTALVAAAVDALMSVNGGTPALLASALSAGTLVTSGGNMGPLQTALGSSSTPASNPYAYVSASLSFIPH